MPRLLACLLLVLASGASAQPARVLDLFPGNQHGVRGSSMAAYDGRLYFSGTDGTSGAKMWAYDEATDTAVRVGGSDGNSDPMGFTVYNDSLFFAATRTGVALYAYDSRTDTTTEIPGARGPGGDRGGEFIVYDDALYFSAFGDGQGTELWRYDGATGTVELAVEIEPGPNGSDPRQFAVYNGRLFFSAETQDEGRELWSYDAASGAATLIDVRPGGDSATPGLPTVYAGGLYFSAIAPDVGRELHVFNGTGVEVAAEVRPGAGGGVSGEPMAVFGGALYFQGNDGVTGNELWSYSGSPQSEQLAADIHPGTSIANSFPTSLTPFEGRLYFSAEDGTSGQELWSYNGDATLVANIRPGEADSAPESFTPYGTSLYFIANDGASGRELWRLRGTSTASGESPDASPEALEVTGANPFRGRTSVRVRVASPEAIEVALFDALGRRVRSLFRGTVADETSIRVSAEGLAPGTYVIRASGDALRASRAVTVVR